MSRESVTASEYCPQANGQVERYNETLVARLRHYITKQQADLDDYVQPLAYGSATQVQRTTKPSLYSSMLSRESPGASMKKKMEF